MIIVRSPLRISLGGGGTDLPSYYDQYGGFVLGAAIDKYIFIVIQERFFGGFLLKYSKLEEVEYCQDIKHPIIRTALDMFGYKQAGLEITSIADVPAGTGLGSSGSFTVALLKALHDYRGDRMISAQILAEEACHIEMDVLKEPSGKQDQYMAASGGITCLEIDRTGQVTTKPALLSKDTLYTLEDNLALFFTGYSRKASEILEEQASLSRVCEKGMLDNLHRIKELGRRIQQALETGQLTLFGQLLNEHWQLKRQRSPAISNVYTDELYQLAMSNGALGGKLVGAGGGGFLMFYTENRGRLREAMSKAGARELRFKFDFEGAKTVLRN